MLATHLRQDILERSLIWIFLSPPFLSPSEIEIIFADSRDVFFKPKDDFFSNSRDVFFEPPRWKVAD